jgi:hypothetical protein
LIFSRTRREPPRDLDIARLLTGHAERFHNRYYANTAVNLAQVERRATCGDGEDRVHGGAGIAMNESRVYMLDLSETCVVTAHA